MNRKAWLLFVALALIALLGLWWSTRAVEPGHPPSNPPTTGIGEPEVLESAATSSALGATEDAGRRSALEPALAGAALRDRELGADGQWYEVLVVDGATQQAVADATTWCVDDVVRARLRSLPAAEQSALASVSDGLAMRYGRVARSDAQGRVRLFASRTGFELHGSHGGRYGVLRALSREASAPQRGHRLVLLADETLRVRVLDAEGRPGAGVPLEIQARHADGVEVQLARTQRFATDAEGLGVFAHLQELRRSDPKAKAGEPAVALIVRVAIGGLGAEPAQVDATAPMPEEPLILRLPPCGAMTVRFLFEGEPLPGVEQISLRTEPAPAGRTGFQWLRPTDAEGAAHFPFVPVQHEMVVGTTELGRGIEHAVVGPQTVGESVRREIDLAEVAVAVRGRVLAVDGTTLANAMLRLEFDLWSSSGTSSGSRPLETDARGNFRVLWGAPGLSSQTAQARAERVLRSFELAYEDPSAGLSKVRIEQRVLQLGTNDLGDVRLAVASVVCRGRLVGFDGTPDGLQVAVECATGSDESPRWRGSVKCHGTVAADGSFVVAGSVAEGRLRLRVHGASWMSPPPVPFELGQTDLEVRVERGVAATIECLLPLDCSRESLSLVLRDGPADAAYRDLEELPARFGFPVGNGDRRFAVLESLDEATWRAAWRAIEPGRYRLCVEVRGHARPVLEVADVVLPLPAGGDVRLAPLDLRAVLHQVVLSIHAAEPPTERSRWEVFPLPQQANERWRGASLVGSGGPMLLGTAVREVLVTAPGHVPQRVAVGGDAVAVTMSRWPLLEVLLAPGTTVPEGLRVGARVRALAQSDPKARFRTNSSEGRLAELLAPVPKVVAFEDGRALVPIGDGPHQLDVVLLDKVRDAAMAHQGPLQVAAGAPVTVSLDDTEVRRAVATLRPVPANGVAPK
ncbi:MAG: hypothetical protein U1F60_03375 [Planctomycetota bacterium]